MKALQKKELGFGNLEVVDVEEPSLKPDQIKILVKAAGVCGTDLETYKGNYNVATPLTLGHEFAGEVVEVGKSVTEFEVGDQVTSETTFYICGECRYCKSKDYNLCSNRKGLGSQQDGGFAKYVIARKESVHKLPENVDYISAALTEPLACAYHAVKEKADIKEGDVVAILGPGPIGLLAAQVAKTCGAEVIIAGLDADKDRLKKAEELGIDRIVNLEQEDINEVIADRTKGYGADVVIECSGAVPACNMGLDILRKKSEFVQLGIFPEDKVKVNFDDIVQKEIEVIGSRSQKPSCWPASLELMNSGAVDTKSLVTHQFNIDEWDKAYEAIENSEAIKVVLKPIE
ncbi:zinc-binding dehydrogenase [Halanaerocella petrolearia]